MKKGIFYDLETTGLNFKKDKIIEIAAFDPVENKTFHTLINPKQKITSEAINIHGITNEMVENAPFFEDIALKFLDFCKKSFLIAHNNDNFDILFLKEELKSTNIEIPEFQCIDTLKWARKYRPDLPKHTLQYLREIYNIEKNRAHRAMDDVIILYKVFKNMIGDLLFEDVFDILNRKTQLVMPFGKHRGKPLKEVPKTYISWLLKNDIFEKPQNQNLKEEFLKLNLI